MSKEQKYVWLLWAGYDAAFDLNTEIRGVYLNLSDAKDAQADLLDGELVEYVDLERVPFHE